MIHTLQAGGCKKRSIMEDCDDSLTGAGRALIYVIKGVHFSMAQAL